MEGSRELVGRITAAIIDPLIVLLIVSASVYFLWGLAQFVANAENSEAREEGKRKILWGIIGLVIMVSVFAILQIVLRTFGIDIPEELR